MNEHGTYLAVVGAMAFLSLVFLIVMLLQRRFASVLRWAVQGLLLFGAVSAFGEICAAVLKEQGAAKEFCRIRSAGGMILAAWTLLTAILIFWEGKRIQKLAGVFTASRKGVGRTEKKPLFLDKDMETLWNRAWDCGREIERMQYQQLSQRELYFRFVPKAAERLFSQKDFEDVTAGDFLCRKGIIGCISVQADFCGSREAYHGVKSQISDLFLTVQEEGEAVFFPQSGDLKKMWGIFFGKAVDAAHLGVRLFAGLEERKLCCDVTMLLYPSGYTYGITGNKSRVFPYFSADDGEEFLFYSERLRELGVKFAVTKEMAEEFLDAMSVRGIGYIKAAGERRDLCEVLEAYPAARRRRMERQTNKFAKALELYYKSDFYLARNLFAEVFKECPMDHVAKWYLFACENRLGSVKSAEADFGLFAKI